MNGHTGVERRRTPRCAVRTDVRCRVEVRVRVRVVDISATGALLATELQPAVGSSALLKSGIGAGTFTSEVQVRRAATAAGSPALGVSFTSVDERNRRSLEEFLKKAGA
jgi:c-di-GMP-binding flagellar brake protein YcgR